MCNYPLAFVIVNPGADPGIFPRGGQVAQWGEGTEGGLGGLPQEN